MKLPEYNEDTRRIGKEPSASKITNEVKWIFFISFLLLCITFGYGIGRGLGEMFGNDITILNEENEARRIKIISLDN